MSADGTVATVLGPVPRAALGIVLPHEHLFINLMNQYHEPADPEKQRRSREPIRLDNYGFLRRNPYALRDNLLMDDVDLAVEEAGYFRQAGGRTIVDCTPIGIGRDPERLRQVAERTGLNIVAGCGYYTHDTHPPAVAARSVEDMAEGLVRDLTAGIGGTGIRAGVIGEIGTSAPIHPDEAKMLRAAALAHQRTGAPLQVHTYPWGTEGLAVLRLLTGMGVPANRIVICHTDVAFDLPYVRRLLDEGVYVQFDNFGKEFYIDPEDRAGYSGGVFASDPERVRVIRQLVDWGYAKQLLITNDLCLKQMLRRYGGWGYAHILRHIVPMLAEHGISEETIGGFVRDNPVHWLCGQARPGCGSGPVT